MYPDHYVTDAIAAIRYTRRSRRSTIEKTDTRA